MAWLALACGGRFEHTPDATAGVAGVAGAASGGQNGVAGSSDTAGTGAASASTNGVAFRSELRDKPIPLVDTRGGPSPASPGSPVRVGLDPSVVLRELPSSLVGINTAVWDGDQYLLNTIARARLAAVGTQLLRFPGGSSSDQYYWDGDVPSSLTGNPPMWTQPWAVSSGELATLGQELWQLGSRLRERRRDLRRERGRHRAGHESGGSNDLRGRPWRRG